MKDDVLDRQILGLASGELFVDVGANIGQVSDASIFDCTLFNYID